MLPSLHRVLRAPELVLPLVLVCALQAGQQLSGINAVFYYSNSVFRTAGLDDVQTQYATLGCGCVNLATALLSVSFVNGCGRRVLMLLSSLSACFCLTLLGTSIITIVSTIDPMIPAPQYPLQYPLARTYFT